MDSNQNAIVAALKAAGCSVQSLAMVGQGCPDLIVCRAGKMALLELKAGRGKVNQAQYLWALQWNGPVHYVRSVDEALDAMGIVQRKQTPCPQS